MRDLARATVVRPDRDHRCSDRPPRRLTLSPSHHRRGISPADVQARDRTNARAVGRGKTSQTDGARARADPEADARPLRGSRDAPQAHARAIREPDA